MSLGGLDLVKVNSKHIHITSGSAELETMLNCSVAVRHAFTVIYIQLPMRTEVRNNVQK